MTNMAGWWAGHGVQVTLITFSEEPTVYALHPAVRRLFIDSSTPADILALPEWPVEAENVARLRDLFLQTVSDAPIISFLPRMNLRTLMATQGLGRHVIVCERAWPKLVPLGEATEGLRRTWYPLASRLVVQTKRCAVDWAAAIVPPERIRVIPNAIPPLCSCPQLHKPELPRRFVLAGGRMELQKNFFALIEAFALVAPRFPEYCLLIAGEGSLRSQLEAQVKELNLADRILLPGFVKNLSPYYRAADAFVLSSAFEGFPNILLEAMAAGCPAVAFDCPTGPADIIRDGVDGLLVPPGDTAALGTGLERLLRDNALRATFAARAIEVRQRFAEDAIMALWNRELCNGETGQ